MSVLLIFLLFQRCIIIIYFCCFLLTHILPPWREGLSYSLQISPLEKKEKDFKQTVNG